MSSVFLGVLSGVGQTFLVAGIGFAGRLTGVISDESLRHLTRITIAILLPCFLFEAVFEGFAWAEVPNYGLLMVSGIAMLLIGLGLGHLGSRALGLSLAKRRTVMALCGFNNSVNIPIPLALALFTGVAAQEMLVLITLYSLLWSILIWSLGVWLLAPADQGETNHLRQALLNPPVLAILVGMAATVPGLRTALNHPALGPIHLGVNWVGDAAIPIALLILGGILAGLMRRLGQVDWRAIGLVTAVKLVAVPLVALIAIQVFGAFAGLLGAAVMIQAASPPATNLIIIAEHWEGDVDAVGATLVVTYLLSFFTFVIWLTPVL